MQEIIDLRVELDQLISRLNGVVAARTVLSEDDSITEIHVLSDLSKSPKQLVRDIQSAAMALLGIELDYKMISVAQVGSHMLVSGKGSEPRLMIRRITLNLDSQNQDVTVVLARGDKTYEGHSRGPLHGKTRLHTAAYACLNALKVCRGPDCELTLLELKQIEIAGTTCCTTAVSMTEPFGDYMLYGIAPASSPEMEMHSVVMSVLSALNRPISRPKRT